jgi:hypothetical protein
MRIRSRDAEVPASGDLDPLLALQLSSREDQLEALRGDWEDVTQRVSRVLVDYLDRKHDAH